MTDTQLERAPADTWDGILANLRQTYPGQKDSVLFCIFKLQQNPDLTLRDFREEAALHGIPMAGRALHSGKKLLGLIKPGPQPAVEVRVEIPRPPRQPRRSRPAEANGGSLESRVVAAVRQIQTAAGADSGQLRAAIQKAITILQKALGE